MDRKIFCDALKSHKVITAFNGKNEVWKITHVYDYHVCVVHRFWMEFDNSWLTFSNVVTEIDAYELTELVNLHWIFKDS